MNTPSLEAIKRAHAALIDDLESLAAWARYRRVLKSELFQSPLNGAIEWNTEHGQVAFNLPKRA